MESKLHLWDDEIDICDRAICIGKALDTITQMHEEFMAQFTRVADLRGRFYHAPGPCMATAVYYCDRSLDTLLQSIITSRKNINALCTELQNLRSKCMAEYYSTRKTFRLVELQASTDNMRDSGVQECIHQSKLK